MQEPGVHCKENLLSFQWISLEQESKVHISIWMPHRGLNLLSLPYYRPGSLIDAGQNHKKGRNFHQCQGGCGNCPL